MLEGGTREGARARGDGRRRPPFSPSLPAQAHRRGIKKVKSEVHKSRRGMDPKVGRGEGGEREEARPRARARLTHHHLAPPSSQFLRNQRYAIRHCPKQGAEKK